MKSHPTVTFPISIETWKAYVATAAQIPNETPSTMICQVICVLPACDRDSPSIATAAQAKSQTTRADGLQCLRSANFETQASKPNEVAPKTHISMPDLMQSPPFSYLLSMAKSFFASLGRRIGQIPPASLLSSCFCHSKARGISR